MVEIVESSPKGWIDGFSVDFPPNLHRLYPARQVQSQGLRLDESSLVTIPLLSSNIAGKSRNMEV